VTALRSSPEGGGGGGGGGESQVRGGKEERGIHGAAVNVGQQSKERDEPLNRRGDKRGGGGGGHGKNLDERKILTLEKLTYQ